MFTLQAKVTQSDWNLIFFFFWPISDFFIAVWPAQTTRNPIFSHQTWVIFLCGPKLDMYLMFSNVTLVWIVRCHFISLWRLYSASDVTITVCVDRSLAYNKQINYALLFLSLFHNIICSWICQLSLHKNFKNKLYGVTAAAWLLYIRSTAFDATLSFCACGMLQSSRQLVWYRSYLKFQCEQPHIKLELGKKEKKLEDKICSVNIALM